MSSKQLYWTLLGGCALLAALLIASVFFGTSLLQEKSSELEEAKIEREVVDMQESSLIQAKQDIEKFSELEQLSKRIIPQEKDQARTVRELIAIAKQSGVTISTVSFPTSNLGVSEAAASDSSGKSIITQAEPVQGLSDLYELDVSIQVNNPVRFNQLISFLEGLEKNRRTSQVQAVTITPDSNERDNITFNISLAVFLKP